MGGALIVAMAAQVVAPQASVPVPSPDASVSAGAEPGVSQPAAPVSDPAGAAQPAGDGLQEIVVTAQRRSENLQRVPIAVTTATGTQLRSAGILDTQSLNVVTPGLTIRTTVGAFQPFIRGIGTSASIVENPVALYIDGVYLPQQREGVRELNDIEQIAVLKGPQGTLFGRNATGGVIQITTRAPSHDFSGQATARVDNYGTIHGDTYVTGGLADSVAVSLSSEYSHQADGWGRNLTTGHDTYRLDHQFGLRGKLLFEPGPNTKVTLIGDYIDRFQHASSFQPYPGTLYGLEGRTTPDGRRITLPALNSVYDTYSSTDGVLGFKGGGGSVTAQQDLGFAKLVSISSYRRGNGISRFDNSPVATVVQSVITDDQPSTSYTEELQLLSRPGGSLTWSIGGYYYHYINAAYNTVRVRTAPLLGPGVTLTSAREKTESVAPFAQADWEFVPATKLTVGARYTYEKRSVSGTFNPVFNPSAPAVGAPTPQGELTFKQPTFRVALSRNFTPTILGYLSFNTGFKSGGFNIFSPTAPGYQPEKIKAYEGGLKTELFDRRLRFNVAGFYYDYSQIQVNQIAGGVQIITNGAKAEIYGLDADLEARIATGLRINAGLELLHAEFTNYPNALKNLTTPPATAVVGTGDARGNRLPLAQKVSGTVSANYERDVTFGTLGFNATASFNGDYFFEADNFLRQPGYTILNTQLRWTSLNERLSFMVFANNLLDKKVITQTSSQTLSGYSTAYGNAPRTYGVSGTVRF